MSNRLVSELTPAGRGAICVLGLRAENVAELLAANFVSVNKKTPLAKQPLFRPVYGYWVDPISQDGGENSRPQSELREDVIVWRRSESALEIHCHGGQFAKSRILGTLADAGFRQINPQAFELTPRSCGIATSARSLMMGGLTVKTAAVLNWQACGSLQSELFKIESEINHGRPDSASDRIQELLSWCALGLHLTRPWKVVFTGPPNVGKSCLINRLLGYQRSIVHEQPGTTRDLVATLTAIDGWPFELIDSAGIRRDADPIEAAGMALAEQALARADLVVHVEDVTAAFRIPAKHSPMDMSVLNKCDLACPELPNEQQDIPWITSAKTGEGIPRLIGAIRDQLIPREPAKGQAIPFLPEQVDQLRLAADQVSQNRTELASQSIRQIHGQVMD